MTDPLDSPPGSPRRPPSPPQPLQSSGRMVKPRVDKLLEHVDSQYAAVVVAARARQINSYFHNLGEGSFGEYPPPMVEAYTDRTTSRSPSKSSLRASSATSTAFRPAPPETPGRTDGQDPARRNRRDRGLQVA